MIRADGELCHHSFVAVSSEVDKFDWFREILKNLSNKGFQTNNRKKILSFYRDDDYKKTVRVVIDF